MRYLFGDSAPFPLQYNFLSALQTFVAHAARAVQLDAEVKSLKAAQTATEAARANAIEELAKYHQSVLRSLQSALPPGAEQPTLDYVRAVSDRAVQFVDEARSTAIRDTDQERARLAAEVDRRRGDARNALAAFMIVLRLPVSETDVSMRLRDGGTNELSAVFKTPPNIVARFTLSTREVLSWHHPRKVGEFAKGVNLPVGVKRSWFGKGVQHETVLIDDYVLGGFDLSDEHAAIWLRRRPTDKDAIVLNLRRDDDKLAAEVHHPGDVAAESLPATLEGDALDQLERMCQLLRAGVADVLPHKERLEILELDGEDITQNDKATAFIEAVIRTLAPTVGEIARRSPNPNELSLKAENDAGRREEFYVKKADLVAKLEGLGVPERAVFAPLGLEGARRTLEPPPPVIKQDSHVDVDELLERSAN